MTPEAATHRRRAAFAALQPVLGADAARHALAPAEPALMSDAVADVILYVDALCTAHALGDDTRRALYGSLFEALRQSPDALPEDPWPSGAEQTANGNASHPSAPAPASAVAAPAANAWPASGALSSLSLTGAGLPGARGQWRAGQSPSATSLQPVHRVFEALMQSLMQWLHDDHPEQLRSVQMASQAEFARANISAVTRETVGTAWHQHPDQAWRVIAPADELAELVHRMHLALCRLLGDVEADRLLTLAARNAAATPAAQTCPPGRLL